MDERRRNLGRRELDFHRLADRQSQRCPRRDAGLVARGGRSRGRADGCTGRGADHRPLSAAARHATHNGAEDRAAQNLLLVGGLGLDACLVERARREDVTRDRVRDCRRYKRWRD